MKFHLAAFWLFLLTVGGKRQQQLSADCCHGAATWGMPTAAAAAAAAVAPKLNSIDGRIGNESQNATKFRVAAIRAPVEPPPVIGDITTTTTWPSALTDATTLTAKTIAQLAFKSAKANSLELSFKQRMAQLFASEEQPESTLTTTTTPATPDSDSSTHHPERRHVVPDKLLYTPELQIKQGRLMGITRRFQVTSGLREVDQYLGLPYAEAPTGSRRFMPPGE